jgi:hypothetical protein
MSNGIIRGMSEENRPNLNAVGVLTDIFQSIDARRRGAAKAAPFVEIMDLVSHDAREFIELVNTLLDERFGGAPGQAIVIRNPSDSDMLMMVAATNKFFEDAINNMVAPVTRAWTDYKVDKIVINPGDIQDNDVRFTMTVSAQRRNTWSFTSP